MIRYLRRPVVLHTCEKVGLLAAMVLLASCSSDPTGPPPSYRLEIVSGSDQIDTVGALLSQPLVVRVSESSGRAGAGQVVVFVLGAASGSVSAESVTTNAQGLAQVRWTLGMTEGAASVRATLRGRTGSGDVTFFATATAPTLRAVRLAVGYEHGCAIMASYRLYCWGLNDQGQLGLGTPGSRNTAVALPGALLFDRVAAGANHTCALTTAGELYCWGRNVWGQIGDGSTETRLSPVRIAPDLRFAGVVAGAENTCALTVDAVVYCWGFMVGSQSTNSRLPADVSGGIRLRSLNAGDYKVCGISVDDRPYCMTPTQVVDGTSGGSGYLWRPQPAPSPSFKSFSGGLNFMCGLDDAGKAMCWGDNLFGQLGIGSTSAATGVVPVSGGHTFTSLYSGYDWTCGVTPLGPTYCWGHNSWGVVIPVVGQQYVEATPRLREVPPGVTFTAMDGGVYHMCGIAADTQVYCWGGGFNGQLGDGHSTGGFYSRSALAPVLRS